MTIKETLVKEVERLARVNDSLEKRDEPEVINLISTNVSTMCEVARTFAETCITD